MSISPGITNKVEVKVNPEQLERHFEDVALARYAVIAPLVSRQLSSEERSKVMAEILAATHRFPDGKARHVSLRSLNRWCRWYTNGHTNEDDEVVTEPGLVALRPLPRADRGKARVVDTALIERAVQLRRELPERTTGTLVALLKSEAREKGLAALELEEATLAYHLRQRKATKKQLKAEGRSFPRYSHPRRNACWQGDWSQGVLLPDPTDPKKTKMSHLHCFIDDHTRYVVHAEFYFRQNLPCLEDCFRKAILSGGIPEMVYWDNGSVYQSKQIQRVAARLKSQVVFATPYCPEGKGKVERWFRTCKESFYPEARVAGLQTLEQLNQFFWGWLETRYHMHIHSELKATPRERWETAGAQPRFPEPASLVDLFLWEEVRLVDKSGCIKLSGNAYPVAEHLVGHKVMVRFDPFDLSRVRLYENGIFSQALEPQTLVNRTFRKARSGRREKPRQLDSSTNYRKQVERDHQNSVEKTLEAVQSGGNRGPLVTLSEFLALLSSGLEQRELTVSERLLAEQFFHSNAPLAQFLVRQSLLQSVDAKGSRRHLRYYLEAVRRARQEASGQ